MTTRSWQRALPHAAVLLGALSFFGWVSGTRIVDDDEGFYALAGRAMFEEGLLPYRDFFLPQLPVAPALYGSFQSVFGVGLVKLRWLTASAAAVSAWLVFVAASRRAGPRGGALGVFFFCTHVLVWEWLVTVKTFAVTVPLVLGALLVATDAERSRRRWFFAGALSGLCGASRLLALPVVFVVALRAWWVSGSDRSSALYATALGSTVGFLPAVMFALASPEAFWFDNVTFHGLRSGGDALVEDLPQKLATLREVLLPPLGATRPDVTGLQTVLLLIAAGLEWRRRGPPPGPQAWGAHTWGAAAVALSAVALLPSPAFAQYFAVAVGPLAVLGGAGLGRRLSWRFTAGACGVLVATSISTFHDRIIVQPGFSRPAALDRVGQVLDALTREGDRVAAHWPAYLAGSERRPLPEARSRFSRLYSESIEPAARGRYHLFVEADLRRALLERRARAFVVGRFVEPRTALALRHSGWHRASDMPGVTVWLAPGSSP